MAADLTDDLKERAFSLGFARAGVARSRFLAEDAGRLREWLKAGFHAGMRYLERSADVRVDPSHPGMLPGARSVLVLAAPYPRPEERGGPAPGRIAAYARGRDYHGLLYKRAGKLVRLLRERGFRARCSVDSMPILERAWARLSGVGFIGKNCCLIAPGLGSYLFLAVVLTDAVLRPDRTARQRCGRCTLCLESCPTGALVAERRLDAGRCVSYLTGVHRGALDERILARIGDRIFGCDACQECCPFNRAPRPDPRSTAPFAADSRWSSVDAVGLLEMDEEALSGFARGSPLRRPGRESLARNAAVVLGNAGGAAHLPALTRAAGSDPSPVVRATARWATRQIRTRQG